MNCREAAETSGPAEEWLGENGPLRISRGHKYEPETQAVTDTEVLLLCCDCAAHVHSFPTSASLSAFKVYFICCPH